jgi:AcrR family transcriptional regulator
MSENSKPDRRVARTQNALWVALRALLQERRWDDINIKLICDRADVARSSFYVHFGTKSELLDFGFVDILKTLLPIVIEHPAERNGFATTNWLVDHITQNPGFFMKVAQLGTDKFLFARFTIAIEDVLSKEIQAMGRPVDTDTIVFAVNGSFAVIRRWMENGCAENAADLKQRLSLYLGQIFKK